MYTYDKLFSEYRHTVAQILLTADDIADPVRHENFQNTIQRLLELDAIPIVNENDTVSVAEFGIGDNDTLSAIVATSVHADLLVLLSDIDGLYTADPHKIQTLRASNWFPKSQKKFCALPTARVPSLEPAA